MTGLMDLAEGKKAKPGFGEYAASFGQSALSSIPELFGVDPASSVESWRQTHPWSGLASELLGTAVPYVGWGGATRRVKAFDDFVKKIGDVERAPIVTRGAQEIARFTPFEIGRGLIASTAGGEPFGEQALQSAVNLGFAGVGGGVFGALEAAGPALPKRPLADIAPTVQPDAPLQLKLRQLRQALANGEVTDALAAENRFASWLVEARRELPGYGQRHIGALEGAVPDLSRDIERNFFKVDDVPEALRSGKGVIVRQFSHAGKTGYLDEGQWRAAATLAELPDEFPMLGQYFRSVEATTEKAAKRLENVANKLTRVGDWRIGKEADGNYVVLRQLQTVGETKPGSRWVAFKTDEPSLFSRELSTWKRLDDRWASWLPEENPDLAKGGELLQAGLRRNKELPLVDYAEMQKTGKLERLGQMTGPLGQGVRQFTEHYLTPTINQFSRSPLANWIWSGAKDLYNMADLKTNDLLLGTKELSKPGDVVAAIWAGTRPQGEGLRGLIEKLSPDQVKSYYSLIARRPSNEALDSLYASGTVDEQTYLTYKAVEAAATKVFESVNSTKRALGSTVGKAKEGHGGFSRKWEGSLKMGLTDEGGRLIAIADGENTNAVLRRAQFIEEKLQAEGITGLRRGKIWDGEGAVPKELKVWQRDPGFIKNDLGVRGFKWDFGQFGTKGDLVEELQRNIALRYREEASEALQGLFANDLMKLKDLDPKTWTMLVERLNALKGEAGPVTTLVNKVVDPILAPILGKGSAGKIVDGINKAFWNLQLGMFNVAYPVANLIGVFQTVMPELAFVMNGAPERLAGYYSMQLVRGQKAHGMMSVLDPMKILSKGMAGIFKPDAEFRGMLSRAVNEGVIDPKFLEEFAGQNASQVGRLRDILHGGKDGAKAFVQAAEAISAWMPSASERFARSMAFSSAYHAGKDVLGLSDDALYAFAKKFTDRTMYNYSMADRSMVLTSPVGRLFGSMKNWVSHYISNMMLYAGEAGRGNIAPLAWQMATTGLIGGIGAVPLLPSIAGGYSKAVEDQDLLPWLYGSVGQRAGDALYLGLPATLGASFASATANPLRDANMLLSLAIQDRAKAMGRSFGAAVDHWQSTGEHPASSELARGAFARAFAPKILYRGLQVYDNPGLQSLTTGYPIIDEEINPWNKALFVAGFTPTEIERGYMEFDALMKDKGERQRRVSRYGVALADGLKNQDGEAIDAVVNRAIADGLDLSQVLRSANSRIDKDSQGMLERNFSAAQRQTFTSIGER